MVPVVGLWDYGAAAVVGPLHLLRECSLLYKEMREFTFNGGQEPCIKYANNTTQTLHGVGIINVEVNCGKETRREEVIAYVVDDNNWDKVLFGRTLMNKIGLDPTNATTLESMMKLAREKESRNGSVWTGCEKDEDEYSVEKKKKREGIEVQTNNDEVIIEDVNTNYGSHL